MRYKSLFKKHQALIILLTALITGIFLIYLIFDVFGKVSPQSYTQLTDMTINVEHKDGTIDTFNSHLFNYNSKDDVITINLSLDESLKKEHQSINFFFYGSVVKAYYKEKLLASYGEGIRRHMIGHLRVSIPVPLEAYGDEIKIVIKPTIGILEDTFRPPMLMSESSAMFFPIIGFEAFYAIFSVIIIISFLGIVVFTFLYHTFDFAKEGTWLMALIFAITLWYVGNSGMVYMFTASEDINAISEYIGMYLLFTAAPLYASFETERPKLKKYLETTGSALFIVFLVCNILYFLPTGFTYVTFLRQAQTLQIVMVFSSLISLLSPGKKVMTTADYLMRYGLAVVAVFGIMEQIRIIIAGQITESHLVFMQLFAKMHFSIVLILALVITLTSAYCIKVKTILQRNLKERQLEKLAYTDNLTSLSNRQFLQKKLNLLDSEKEKDYSVIFIDINDLKFANDNFGHEAGDQLIKMVAFSIRDAMESNMEGFTGRNGGDEFICVVIPSIRSFSMARSIQENLALAVQRQNPSFPVSISIGIASYDETVVYTGRKNIDSSDVIKLADKRMYDNKCIMKKNKPKTM